MSILHAIGFWQEEGNEATLHRPTPQRLVDPMWLHGERLLLADYLRRATPLHACLGYSFCRFKCGIPDHRMGCSEFTDGTFIWPEGLAHYVELHAVKLPESFVEAARSRHWLPPALHFSPEFLRNVRLDHALWHRWADTAMST